MYSSKLKDILKTKILFCITIASLVLFSSCKIDNPTSVPLDDNKQQNDNPVIDNHNYAPLQVGNEWTYIQNGHHGVYRVEPRFDKFTKDSVVVKITGKSMLEGTDKFIASVYKHTFDSIVYHSSGSIDSVVKSEQTTTHYDTLTIVGDSILPRPSQSGFPSSEAPFFNFIDYPSYKKSVVDLKGKKLLLAHNATAYYLDTYGLIKWENSYSGNGWGFVYTIRLFKFNEEIIDSSLVDFITK
jgi:hypothetical protein